jgi:hypothetical protein
MLIARGSIVDISGIKGALSEDVNINLKSNYRTLASDFQNEITQMIDIAGAAVRSVSRGRIGFSSQFKQMTTQIWDKTDPARFQINVDFHRVPLSKNSGPQNVSGENVMRIIKQFCTIPLPEENELTGNLIPPGPSPIEGIGIDQFLEGKGVNITNSKDANIHSIVDVTIGSMCFRRMLMESAEPVLNKYSDDSGYPISCRIVFSFISIWAATKLMVRGW